MIRKCTLNRIYRLIPPLGVFHWSVGHTSEQAGGSRTRENKKTLRSIRRVYICSIRFQSSWRMVLPSASLFRLPDLFPEPHKIPQFPERDFRAFQLVHQDVAVLTDRDEVLFLLAVPLLHVPMLHAVDLDQAFPQFSISVLIIEAADVAVQPMVLQDLEPDLGILLHSPLPFVPFEVASVLHDFLWEDDIGDVLLLPDLFDPQERHILLPDFHVISVEDILRRRMVQLSCQVLAQAQLPSQLFVVIKIKDAIIDVLVIGELDIPSVVLLHFMEIEEIPQIVGNPDLSVRQEGLVDTFDDDFVADDLKGAEPFVFHNIHLKILIYTL